MGLLSLFKTKHVPFFSAEDQQLISDAVALAEKHTSGEVRVYVESRCRFMDALDRAVEIFHGLKMDQTGLHNAVLVYVALKDKQLAVYADAGIHEKLGDAFWKKEVDIMLAHFNKENYAAGIATVVRQIGDALCQHFPYDGTTDKNELPDEIVFGR
ncbi:MAG: hypothetical protein JWN76_1873 [Chitinophagaceae bacterium]|nr:hypothetical protein [Chitinophagaceae bacterium]